MRESRVNLQLIAVYVIIALLFYFVPVIAH
jgi:hypothetical protein